MQALWFLSSRSLYNGIRRAVTSGRRLFTLIVAVAYYAFLVFRPMGSGSTFGSGNVRAAQLPPELVECGIFGFFAILSLLLMISVLTPRGGFRQSDVDVLFPTPISPRVVMFFRVFRDYLVTLLTPLILMMFGGRASWSTIQAFLAGTHGYAFIVSRVTAVAWFLMAFTWVSVSYGVGFFVNRSDLEADRNKRALNVLFVSLLVATVLYFTFCLRTDLSWETALACSQSSLVRSVFFTATAATWMVMGAIHNNVALIMLGVSVLLGASALGLFLANSQLRYMYDQAAVKGFSSAEQRVMRRNNDIYGLAAQQARDGKVRVGHASRWIGNIHMVGASALVWKEVLLQMRGGRFLYFLFGPVQLLMTLSPLLVLSDGSSDDRIRGAGNLIILMQSVSVLMLTMNSAISGFTELLKRVDFQKPLPFRPAGTVFWEVASKCIPNVLFAAISFVAVLVLKQSEWSYALASFIFVLGFSLLVSSTVFLVKIAFPDAGDASQRGFRGILILLALVILGLPGVAVMGVLLGVFQINPILASLPATAICIGISILVCFFSGGLYDSYNPSE